MIRLVRSACWRRRLRAVARARPSTAPMPRPRAPRAPGRLAEAARRLRPGGGWQRRARATADQARWAAADVLSRAGRARGRRGAARRDGAGRDERAAGRGGVPGGAPAHRARGRRARVARHGGRPAALPGRTAWPTWRCGGSSPTPTSRAPQAGLDELAALEHDLGKTELVELVAFLSARAPRGAGRRRRRRATPTFASPTGGPTPTGPSSTTPSGRRACSTRSSATRGPPPRTSSASSPQRETTTLMGSYERATVRAGDAAPRRRFTATRLHDHARARETFHRLYTRLRALVRSATTRSGWRPRSGSRTATRRRRATAWRRWSTSSPTAGTCPARRSSCPGLERPSKSEAPKDMPRLHSTTPG